jgi:hypothetical protein
MTKLVRPGWLMVPALMTGAVLAARPAEAIPAFAQQTGFACTACHIGAFGPQLTPLGRAFKIGGYTQGGGQGIASDIPLSVMIQTSFTHTAANQNPAPQHYDTNNNFSLDQISGFIGGRLGDHTGGFMQFTWSDVDNTAVVDNVDLRPYTTVIQFNGRDLRLGTTLNNMPTVQDPYNTTIAWGFPYIASALAPTPSAAPLLSGGLGQSALGYTVYAWYDQKLYLEGGAYSTFGQWALARMGQSYGVGATTSPAPYLRAAYEWQWGTSDAHVGATYMHADVDPLLGTPGGDHYTDYAIDGGYQFLGDGTHIVTVQGMFTHEDQNLSASAAADGVANAQYSLNEIRANVSYWYQNTYGLTLGWQRTWGPANPIQIASANDKPNSTAFIVEADWVPFGKDSSWMQPYMNLKLGLQYTAYTQFDGGSTNFDGNGTNASDNNTLLLFAWLIF